LLIQAGRREKHPGIFRDHREQESLRFEGPPSAPSSATELERFLVPVWAQLLPFFRAPDYRKDFGLSAVSERPFRAENLGHRPSPFDILVKKGA